MDKFYKSYIHIESIHSIILYFITVSGFLNARVLLTYLCVCTKIFLVHIVVRTQKWINMIIHWIQILMSYIYIHMDLQSFGKLIIKKFT